MQVKSQKMVMSAPPLAVDVKTAAQLLGLSQRSIWKLVERGELRVRKAGRRVIFPIAAINDFLDGRIGGRVEE